MAVIIAVTSLQAQELLKDINVGTNGSNPINFTEFNGKVIFTASDENYITHLWQTNGEETGTVMLKDIYTVPNISNFSNFTILNNELYFNATLDANEATEWKGIYKMSTDGTFTQIINLTNGGGLMGATYYDGIMYTTATSDDYMDIYLNQHDLGTGVSQRVPVSDANKAESKVADMATVNGRILVYTGRLDEVDVRGRELYEYLPETQNFTLVKEFLEGASYVQEGWFGSTQPNDAGIKYMTEYNNKLYFVANIPDGEYQDPTAQAQLKAVLWETDGTAANTKMITETEGISIATTNPFSIIDGKLYFEGDDGTNGIELWVYDIEANTKSMLTNVSREFGTSARGFCTDGTNIYFSANDGESSWTDMLYKTDGISAPVVLTTDITYVNPVAATNGKIVFTATSATDGAGYELYVYDPSTATAIGDTPTSKTFNIYPNPTQGVLNVKGAEGDATYKLYSLAGAVAQQGKITNEQITLNVARGVYMLEISAGATSEVQKVVIK